MMSKSASGRALGRAAGRRWRLSLIKGTPAKFIDFAYTPDAETAEQQVADRLWQSNHFAWFSNQLILGAR